MLLTTVYLYHKLLNLEMKYAESTFLMLKEALINLKVVIITTFFVNLAITSLQNYLLSFFKTHTFEKEKVQNAHF